MKGTVYNVKSTGNSSAGMRASEELYAEQMQEIAPIIGDLSNAIQHIKVDDARAQLLYLKIIVTKLNPVQKDGIIRSYIGCFDSPDSVSFAVPITAMWWRASSLQCAVTTLIIALDLLRKFIY